MATKTTEKNVANEGDFAIIKTGGKQYVVRVGDSLAIEKLDASVVKNDKITFDQVLMKGNASDVTIGMPLVAGATVSADLVESFKEKKVIVIKYRQKSRYFKKNGHKQPKMLVKITAIK